MYSQFIHLQCHSEYSLIDGLLRIKPFINKIATLGMPAVALTDQANLFGMVKFYQAALSKGVKPIVGCDVWLENEKKPEQPFRFTFLCQNKLGYNNLTKLISHSYIIGQQNSKAIIKKSWLQGLHQGLIVIGAARDSDIAQALLLDNLELANNLAEYWGDLFLDRFYLGITRTGRAQEDDYIKAAVNLSISKKIPLVATNEVCFLEPDDFEAHEARVCISEGTTLNSKTRAKRYSRQQYLRSADEMKNLFSDLPKAIANTLEIAKRCNFILKLNQVFLPNYSVPSKTSAEAYLIKIAQEGLAYYLSKHKLDTVQHKIYQTRLEQELKVITSMGFASYFLIVADFIKWARDHDIPVGPGRGSGAGSLVAYILKITDIEPLKYDLLFERFLNPERVSMPDFDIDFCMDGRDKVIEYVANHYGRDSVSQIITYGTMAAKAVIRDAGRVLGYSYGFVDKIAKLIPLELGITLEKALQQEELLQQRYQQEEEVKNLIDLAKKLEGITRNVGKHAGGVVIAPSNLTDYVPLYCEANDSQLMTQFDKNDVENIGLVKFDFLGLRTLTIIDTAVKSINNNSNNNLNIAEIKLDCAKTFKLLCDCHTVAIFQLESRGMKDLIRRLQPDRFEDIVALVALFRPGPLQSGMVDDFINRKLGHDSIAYPHPDLKPILQSTYGIILYQEQVMQIAQVLAGYTLGAADLLRRAMGKKKPEEMAKQREIFTNGAVARGVDKQLASYIFDLMEKFAGYGFNKSHSVAYAMLSYQTAWLKAHYPAEFMAAVLSSDMANTDKIVVFIEECRNLGLVILQPNINKSFYKFSVIDSKILYGLGAIKGVGEVAINALLAARKQYGPFADLFDLCFKVDLRKVSRRTLEACINAGALDSLGDNRAALMANLEAAICTAEQSRKNHQQGQGDLFGNTAINSMAPTIKVITWSQQERLTREKNTLGFYLTGHPISVYEQDLANFISCNLAGLQACWRGQNVIIAGLIINMRVMHTKRGNKMAFVTIEDLSGRQEVVFFSDIFNQSYELLQLDELIVISGEVNADEYSGGVKVKAAKCISVEQAKIRFAKEVIININAGKNLPDNWVEHLQTIIEPFKGGLCPVTVRYKKTTSETTLTLGQTWIVRPLTELITALNAMGDYLHAVISYRGE